MRRLYLTLTTTVIFIVTTFISNAGELINTSGSSYPINYSIQGARAAGPTDSINFTFAHKVNQNYAVGDIIRLSLSAGTIDTYWPGVLSFTVVVN